MSFYKNFIAYKAIVRKELIRMFRVWKQTLVPPLVTTLLYFLIFGRFIGSQLRDIEGFSYMQFIVPGLVMLPIITGAFMHTIFSVFFGRFAHTIDDVLVSPVPMHWLILGFVSAGVIRGMLVGSLVLGLAMLFTTIPLHSILALVFFSLVTAIVFALFGFLMGMFAQDFDDTSIIPTFVLQPLIYLGGVFYSISVLPPFWQTVSQFNPILYMINGFRYGALGITDVSVWVGFLILVVFGVLLFGVNLKLLKRGVGVKT